MTYEEALNFDQKWTQQQAYNDLERYLLRGEKPAMKAVAIGMQALEKQIPKNTNREWLNNLSDEDLALWLMNKLVMKWGKFTIIGGVDNVKFGSTQSYTALIEWMKGERENENNS